MRHTHTCTHRIIDRIGILRTTRSIGSNVLYASTIEWRKKQQQQQPQPQQQIVYSLKAWSLQICAYGKCVDFCFGTKASSESTASSEHAQTLRIYNTVIPTSSNRPTNWLNVCVFYFCCILWHCERSKEKQSEWASERERARTSTVSDWIVNPVRWKTEYYLFIRDGNGCGRRCTFPRICMAISSSSSLSS